MGAEFGSEQLLQALEASQNTWCNVYELTERTGVGVTEILRVLWPLESTGAVVLDVDDHPDNNMQLLVGLRSRVGEHGGISLHD